MNSMSSPDYSLSAPEQGGPAKPGLVFQRATREPFPIVVQELERFLGAPMILVIASRKDPAAVEGWARLGREPNLDVQRRLRVAYQAALLLDTAGDSPETIQAWFFGCNPLLDDASPVELLAEGDLSVTGRRVLGAARQFAASG